MRLEQATGPSAAARSDLGSRRLENTLGKLPLGKIPVEKYLTSKNNPILITIIITVNDIAPCINLTSKKVYSRHSSYN